MPKIETSFEALKTYIPDHPFVYPTLLGLIHQYQIRLTISKQRTSVFGNYKYHSSQQLHLISVNGNLNKYAFLLTLLHEIAHLQTFLEYPPNVLPHGKEWRLVFKIMLEKFISNQVFPANIETALLQSIHHLSASSCTNLHLMRILKLYDRPKTMVVIEQLPEQAVFTIPNKANQPSLYRVEKKLRTRYLCSEVNTQKKYLFPALYEVLPVQQ